MTATTFRRFLYSAPGACSLRAMSSWVCCALLLGIFVGSTRAATLSWDANGTSPVNGGSGIWDTSAPLWTSNGGVSYVAWNNSGQVFGTPDSASFATPAGTVTLGTSIIGNSMTFVDPGGYTVDLNGFDLTLSGSTSGVASTTVTNNSATTSTLSLTTIGGVTMSGNLNVTKEGTNGWTPSVPHSFTGVLTLKGGTTTVVNNNFLGSPSGLIRLQDTAGLTLDANATFTRDIELVGTATGITPGNKTVTLSGNIVGTGDFRRTGTQGTVILTG